MHQHPSQIDSDLAKQSPLPPIFARHGLRELVYPEPYRDGLS